MKPGKLESRPSALKLQRIGKRRLATLSGAFSLILSACNLPAKPVVTICVLDFPSGEGICGESGGGVDLKRVPIAELDKSTMFAPREWEKVTNYIHLLEEHVRNGCPR
jgi:hypothetical protein